MPLPFPRGQLGKVNYSVTNFGQKVRAVWGQAWGRKEIVYRMSNGRLFQDSGTGHGIYRPDLGLEYSDLNYVDPGYVQPN